jgi:hypothetical protein
MRKNKLTYLSIVDWLTRNSWLFLAMLLVVVISLVITDLLWHWLNWAAITAIATLLLTAGVVFAFSQVHQSRVSNNARIAMDMFHELRIEKTKDTLRYIYLIEDIKNISKKKLNEIDGVIDKFELLGILVNQCIIDQRLAIEAYAGPPALRIWYKLKKYIIDEREKRGFFADNFEGLVRASLDYLDNNNLTLNFQTIENTKFVSIELVGKLKTHDYLPRSWKEIEEQRKKIKPQ